MWEWTFQRDSSNSQKNWKKKEGLGIEYFVSDTADLKFSNSHFDIVTCFMALMDIENYQNAIREAAGVLKKNERFVFSITHPCFEWGDVTSSGQHIGEWKYEEGTEGSSIRALHYEIARYFGRVKLKSSWDMKRLTRSFATTSFHRTLTDYAQALFENRLLVRRLIEPRPTTKGVSEHPKLRKHKDPTVDNHRSNKEITHAYAVEPSIRVEPYHGSDISRAYSDYSGRPQSKLLLCNDLPPIVSCAID